MDTKRFFRYLAPNLVTLSSLIFGMYSIKCSMEGRFELAGWFIMFSVLTDKLDGFVARLVRGTSEFGVQLDSFADFLNFGVAPAALWTSFFSHASDLPYGSGPSRAFLLAACALWLLAVTFRLARYNIVGDDPKTKRIFFGVPTTLAGGCLVAIFVAALKYGDPYLAQLAQADFTGEARLLGDFSVPRAFWLGFPAYIVIGAVLMASTLRIPKLGKSKKKWITVFIMTNVAAGYVLGALRLFPEYLAFASTLYIVVSLPWGVLNTEVRGLRAPPLFPKVDHPPGREPQRPEDDDLVDDEPEAGAPA
jgi:CDP-diacylglycerol--serine O-phosphatidyltransferase